MKLHKMLAALLMVAVAAFAAVAGEKKTDSPSEVIRKYAEAIRNVDYAALAALSSGESRMKMQTIADKLAAIEKAAQRGDANAVKMLERIKIQLIQAKVALKDLKMVCTGEKIEGDFAEVYVVISGDPNGRNGTGTLHLKKVDGEWKYITPMDYINEAGSRNK